MRLPRPQAGLPSRPCLPRRTARLRLTALYGGLFLVCGAILLGLTYLLVAKATSPGSGGDLGSTPGLGPSISSQQLHHLAQLRQTQGDARRMARDFELKQMLVWSWIALGFVAVAAFALGWLVAGRILRPLATITATAKRISAASLHERLALPGPDDELKELADTIDDLLARLEASFEAQRHFVANASHELRTPVTRERALLEVALADPATPGSWRAAGQELLASNADQEHLIEALLTLATSEAGLDQREPVDLGAVTRDALQAARPQISRLGLHVNAAIQPAVLDGESLLAGRLVANLIDNAVHHNVAGGRVAIATRTTGGCAVLSVASTGPVIPPAEVGRLFQPFQRLNGRHTRHKKGHGLGLSIVRAIATAHGAAITAHAAPGGGLAVDVTFPPPAHPRHRPRQTATDPPRKGSRRRTMTNPAEAVTPH
jgi:signal transduction histidine kinase